MRGFRLFERPVGAFVTLPPLQVVGSLTSYEEGEPYEGRLDIVGAVGRCHVEIVEEDSYLPPGSYAYVDNFNQQVVLKWPAYRPPAPVEDDIINGDFQEGMEGWTDLRGNSWEVRKYEDDDTNVGPGDRPRPAGNLAAWMTGAGRGDHILESIKYPVHPGQSIMARSLWDQGPSNKDNNNLFTALGLYRDGSFIEQVLGDRIHDRTNRTRHWSTVNHVIQPGINEVTVRLIANRRNGRNRVIIADNVETSGLQFEVGNDGEYDFYLVKFRVRDSANRVAYWSGWIIPNDTSFVTSRPYGYHAIERPLIPATGIVRFGTVGTGEGLETATPSLSIVSFEVVDAVFRAEDTELISPALSITEFVMREVVQREESTETITPAASVQSFSVMYATRHVAEDEEIASSTSIINFTME